MKKVLLSIGITLLGFICFSPLSALASEQSVPVTSPEISVRTIPEGAKDISAIKFDRGPFSPDVYVSSRLIKLVVWSGGGAVSVLVAAIPGLGVQMATAVVEVIQGYTGSVNSGIVIHFENGLVDYVESQ